MLSIDQVIESDEVDRVGCPTCDQRRYVKLDCRCCKGFGWVDADQVFDAVTETLSDCCFGRGCHAPFWIAPGCYTVVGGAYVVLSDRTVDYVTDEQMTQAYRIAKSRKRLSFWTRFLARVMPGLRGVA